MYCTRSCCRCLPACHRENFSFSLHIIWFLCTGSGWGVSLFSSEVIVLFFIVVRGFDVRDGFYSEVTFYGNFSFTIVYIRSNGNTIVICVLTSEKLYVTYLYIKLYIELGYSILGNVRQVLEHYTIKIHFQAHRLQLILLAY